MLANQSILITGGSGFIGTNLILELQRFPNVQVLNIDQFEAKADEVRKITKICDLRDKDRLISVVRGFNPDYIIHLAARTDLNGKSLSAYDSNIAGVKNILMAASMLPSLKKILITSSMLVCGPAYYPKNQFDYAPTTLYGESKVETEKIVWSNKPACDWAILRPTSIWGPWFGEPYRNFFDMVLSKKYFHIGRRSCTKTYGYVGNAVYQILQILTNPTTDESNKVFYLGDQPTNIEEWANEIAKEAGIKIRRCPFFLLQLAAWGGDVLKKIGIPFPMTSFRLKNMTTDNVIDLSATDKIAPRCPYTRIAGVRKTMAWMRSYEK